MGEFRQFLTELTAQDTPIFSFQDDNLSKCQGQGILTKLGTCIILRISSLGLLMGKFHQCLTELSARDMIMVGYYSLRFLFVLSTNTRALLMKTHNIGLKSKVLGAWLQAYFT